MMVRVRAWYGALTGRERRLVALAGILAALAVLAYGVILPVGRAFDSADTRHVEAVRRSARLISALRALDMQPAHSDGRDVAGPIDQIVATSAEQAGLVLQSNQPRGNDFTTIAMPSARPAPVFAWFDALAGAGIVVDSLSMTPAPDGSVAINATLRRSGT